MPLSNSSSFAISLKLKPAVYIGKQEVAMGIKGLFDSG